MARSSLLIVLLLLTGIARGASVVTEISGVEGELLDNVRASLSLVRAERIDDISLWRLRQMAENADDEVRDALKPFGFYRPRVDVRLTEPEEDDQPYRARIQITPGDPVRIGEVRIRFEGEGSDDPELLEWREDWPLEQGTALRHARWDEAWRGLARLAEQRGYFDAEFRERRINVNPDRGLANVHIVFDTGPRYRFGRYETSETNFSQRLINRLHILEEGEPFTLDQIDDQRETLVGSRLFERVVVDQQRDEQNHRVDLYYDLEPRPPNTWRATLGFGTDTGARLQLGWDRHYLSSRGNRLESGFGAQHRNEEFVLQSEYQHPRGSKPTEFLTTGVTLRSEQDDFRFRDEDRIEAVFEPFRGRREQAELTFGRMQERRLWPERFRPLEERVFVSFLNESFDAFREASFTTENDALLAANPELAPLLDTDSQIIALGARWRLPSISGSGFHTRGQVWRAEVTAAHDSLGSEISFAQAYLGGRWHWLLDDRHKLLMRGEIGYTEARTRTLDVRLDDRELALTVTDLPERYRFKTGGDRTVRGYGFENLSTNRNGANHLAVGSVEYEYRVGENWSLAAFADVGNAFNDFGDPKLKRGVGAGFRWYTIIGPVQVDLARALDDHDQPWRLHFTIGTQLL